LIFNIFLLDLGPQKKPLAVEVEGLITLLLCLCLLMGLAFDDSFVLLQELPDDDLRE